MRGAALTRSKNNCVLLSQDYHEQYLRDHLRETYGCEAELATELTALLPAQGCVIARLVKHHADGTETTEKFSTPYLVGADGAHSVVRKLAGLSFLGDMKSGGNAIVGEIYIKSGMDPNVGGLYCPRSLKLTVSQVLAHVGSTG